MTKAMCYKCIFKPEMLSSILKMVYLGTYYSINADIIVSVILYNTQSIFVQSSKFSGNTKPQITELLNLIIASTTQGDVLWVYVEHMNPGCCLTPPGALQPMDIYEHWSPCCFGWVLFCWQIWVSQLKYKQMSCVPCKTNALLSLDSMQGSSNSFTLIHWFFPFLPALFLEYI